MHGNKQVCLNIFSVFSGVCIFLKSVSIEFEALVPLRHQLPCSPKKKETCSSKPIKGK